MPKGPASSVAKRRTPRLAPDVTVVDYKDVGLLRTFITDRGKIRSRRVTGITPRQQRAVTRAIKNARELALLPYSSSLPSPSSHRPVAPPPHGRNP